MKESTKLQLEGKLDQVRGDIKKAWGDVTDDEIDRAEGDVTRLVGIIKEKTGQRERDIERRIEQLAERKKNKGR